MTMKKRNRKYHIEEYPFVMTFDPEDKIYIVQSIDLKGCHSDGSTPEEATQNIYEAMKGWLETAEKHHIPIPPPSRQVGKTKKFPLRIEPQNALKLERLAIARNESLNQIINEAISEL